MSKYKIKSAFLKISLFLALGLGSFSTWAWNNMCHSPVQLAALMSPNKPKLSKGEQLKKRISALEKKMEDYENKLDDEEGKLGDSLSQEKLKDDPYSVASSIRSYIENNQNGWPCVEGSSNRKSIIKAFLKDLPVGSSFNQISSLNINFLDLLIPSAYAEKTDSNGKTDSGDGISSTPPTPQIGKTDPCKNRGDDGKCICELGSGLEENDRCVECSSKPGEKWTFKTIGEPCQCIESETIKKDGNKCRLKTCKERGLFGEGSSNCKTQEQIDEEACKKRKGEGKIWNTDLSDCICAFGYGLEGGKCIKCKTKGGQEEWTFTTVGEPCQCEDKNEEGKELILKEGQCRLKTCEDKNLITITNKRGDTVCKSQDQIDKEKCESTPGKEWINGDCKDTPKTACEKQEGKEWKNEKCQDTPEAECNKREGHWIYKNDVCYCPDSYVEEVKDGKKVCREKNKSERCAEKGGIWKPEANEEEGACACPPEHKVENKKCVPKTEQDKCEGKEGMSWIGKNAKDGECVECPGWKKHSAFKQNGKVDSSFCDAYAKDKRACKNALTRLGRLADRLEKYQNSIEKLEEELMGLDDSENVKTEARGVCIDCLKRQLKANRPTASQTFGNIASMIAGVGLGIGGYNVGQIAQTDANMLRIQQGYPVANDNYALQGAVAGYPFLANGLNGMTRVNTPVGGWACTPTVNPYQHAYGGYGYGYGHQMPYY